MTKPHDIKLESIFIRQDQSGQSIQLNFEDDTHTRLEVRPGMTKEQIVQGLAGAIGGISKVRNPEYNYSE